MAGFLRRDEDKLSAAMEAVDRDMGVKGRSLREFDTDRLRANLEIESNEMRASLAVLSADIERMVAVRNNREHALDIVETALEGLGEGEAVEVIKAVAADVTADIRPRPVTHHAGFTTTPKGKLHTSVEIVRTLTGDEIPEPA